MLLKTPSGYVQQSPWLGIANRQLELMGRYMAELGLTPVSRSRVAVPDAPAGKAVVDRIEFVSVYIDKDGNRVESPMGNWSDATAAAARSRRIGCSDDDQTEAPSRTGKVTRIELDPGSEPTIPVPIQPLPRYTSAQRRSGRSVREAGMGGNRRAAKGQGRRTEGHGGRRRPDRPVMPP